jgi:hypothetical protein
MRGEITRHNIGKASDAGFRLAFVIVCLLVLILIGVYLLNGRDETEPSEWYDAVNAMRSLQWYYDQALALARAWQPDAALYWMTLSIHPPASNLPPDRTLAFFSPSDLSGIFRITFRGNKTSTEKVSQPVPADAVPIDISALGFDDKDAFHLAHSNGGGSYVDQFKGAVITLTLRRLHPGGSGPVWWTVRYADPDWRYRDVFAIHAVSREMLHFSNEQDYYAWGSD